VFAVYRKGFSGVFAVKVKSCRTVEEPCASLVGAASFRGRWEIAKVKRGRVAWRRV